MTTSTFDEFISGITSDFTPVLDWHFKPVDYVPVDLSEDNKGLAEVDISSSRDFSAYLKGYLKREDKKVAFGGYLEVRELYRRSKLFTASADEDLNRNIHLGLDLWAKEGTAILAVLDGQVHSFQDNASFGDYGPTIILQHHYLDRTFFSLYGHLSRKSLEGLRPGQEVQKGEKIAELGIASENGDYAPHLHFQVMADLQGKKGDYPGVACRREIDFYLENCPNPNLLLKIGAEGK